MKTTNFPENLVTRMFDALSQMLPKPRLTQNVAGYELVNTFLISAVATILGVRLYLELTGYPQIGSGNLHIAHMLWGGALLVLALLANLLFLDRKIRSMSAIAGGIGFGLFIDELGKFITADNDYFFQPTIALIYLIIICLYLFLQFMHRFSHTSQQEYLANALTIFTNGITHGLTYLDNQQITEYLTQAGEQRLVSKLYAFDIARKMNPSHSSDRLKKLKNTTQQFVGRLASRKIVRVLIVAYVIFQAIASFLLLILIPAAIFSTVFNSAALDSLQQFSFSSLGLVLSTLVAGVLAIIGVIYLPFSKRKAYEYIRYYFLVSIFVVQLFQFQYYQFGALTGLFFLIIALQVVSRMMQQPHLN